jgi:uncharacterized protein (TIGR02646 family)
MKHVVKGLPPVSFEKWKVTGDADWSPTFEDLQNPEKQEVHQSLVREQYFVCCYCGRRIGLSGSHIEHFRPQGECSDLDLDYSNVHASCVRATPRGLPLHCGHAKGGQLDEALLISPLDHQCEQRFEYKLDGGITSSNPPDQPATYMISLLKLDIPLLRSYRQQVLIGVFDAQFILNVTEAELLLLRDGFRRPDSDGHYPNLGHVVARYAEQLLRSS